VRLPWQKKNDFFSEEEKVELVEAIRMAEMRTSGEIRLFVENKCRFMDARDRAAEIFIKLGMGKTQDRNGTLIYVAVKDHQAAVLGDVGIHEKVGQKYWEDEVNRMMVHFKTQNLAQGIMHCIQDIGEALHLHFPYDRDTDKNELPDEIIFGR
jgi:uncharacterized membrane protein